MVLLDQVVQVLRGPDLCVLRQQAIGLHLAYGPVRGSIAIERDGLRRLALMPVLSTCGQLGVDAAIMSAMISLYRDSNLRKVIEAKGQSLDFPDLADRVSHDLRSQRLSVQKAAASMPVGHRAELLRWRNGYDAMFDRVVSHEFLSHGQ